LRHELRHNIVPHLCRLRTDHCRPVVSQDFIVLTTYSGKPNISAILIRKGSPCTRSGEMVRVACTHPMLSTRRVALGGGVLYSRVVQDPFTLWRIWLRVMYVGSRPVPAYVMW
jgi:hypothetical protein